MTQRILRFFTFAALTLGLVGGSTPLALADAVTAPGETDSCYVLTLTSGTASQTAGYTETVQTGPATALLPASYSGGSFSNAIPTETVIPPWADPATDTNFTGATWLSTHTSWPGGTANTEGGAPNDQWRLFQQGFTLPAGAVVSSANLSYAADNASDVYLNGNSTPISSTNNTYGTAPVAGPQNYAAATNASFVPTVGANTLDFVVRNWAVDGVSSNPTGLLYKAVINYCVPVTPPPSTVVVTIDKYIDGAMATAATANSSSFPMSATWDADNIGAGTGNYTLDTAGSYEAATVPMSSGADYATNEVVGGAVVGADCTTGQRFALVGYSTGNTLAEAQAATPTMTSPAFTNLTNNKFVIVRNHDCTNPTGEIGGTVTGGSSPEGTLAVTSISNVDSDGTADNSYENGWSYTFNITVPTNETNLKMKFADWTSPAPGVLPAGGNMKISSAQADNGGATVPIVAANTYSTPSLHMTGDLNPVMAGKQVQVVVQVKIPVNTVNGSYTTTYGVQTLP